MMDDEILMRAWRERHTFILFVQRAHYMFAHQAWGCDRGPQFVGKQSNTNFYMAVHIY